MNRLVDFYLLEEETYKDSTGQVHKVPKQTLCVGMLHSVYEKEFYQAQQAGIRPEFMIKTPSTNYGGQSQILYEGDVYTVYRTYQVGTDQIELYCGARVGNG